MKLSVAENILTSDMVRDRLQAAGTRSQAPLASYHYNDFRGARPLRAALARLLEATSMQGLSLDPQHISVQSGAGAVLETLFWCLAGPGEAVLVPAPYYPAFDNDLKVRSEIELLAVHAPAGGRARGQLLPAAADLEVVTPARLVCGGPSLSPLPLPSPSLPRSPSHASFSPLPS